VDNPTRLRLTEPVLWTLVVQSTALIAGLLIWRDYGAGIPVCVLDEALLGTLYAVRRQRLAGPPFDLEQSRTTHLPALTTTFIYPEPAETLVLSL
jgi:hypothetical protein